MSASTSQTFAAGLYVVTEIQIQTLQIIPLLELPSNKVVSSYGNQNNMT